MKEADFKDVLMQILCSSIRNLFRNQPNINKFTSETGQTEWNISHHLANEISKYIFWLDCDLDITKRNFSNKRPDIVFHKRGVQNLNFLVIEVKRTDNNSNTLFKKDKKKIKDYWMKDPLSYKWGTSIKVDIRNKKHAVYVLNSNTEKDREKYRDCADLKYVNIPPPTDPSRTVINGLVDKILAITQKEDYDPKANTEDNQKVKEYERQIDQLVYKLYNLTPEEIKIVEGKRQR